MVGYDDHPRGSGGDQRMERQRFPLPHLHGDIANEPHIDDLVVDRDARHRQRSPDLNAVLAGDLYFAARPDDTVDAGRAVRLDVSVVVRLDMRRHEATDIAAEHFVARIPPQPLRGRIEMGDIVIAIDDHDSIDCLLKRRQKEFRRLSGIVTIGMHRNDP